MWRDTDVSGERDRCAVLNLQRFNSFVDLLTDYCDFYLNFLRGFQVSIPTRQCWLREWGVGMGRWRLLFLVLRVMLSDSHAYKLAESANMLRHMRLGVFSHNGFTFEVNVYKPP